MGTMYLSQITLPHGHDLKVVVDKAFARLDHSPQDGTVTESEWDIIALRADADSKYGHFGLCMLYVLFI
jgi:hypothetical protein